MGLKDVLSWPFSDEDVFGEQGEARTISTLNKEQQAMMEKLFPYLTSKIGEGLPSWQGNFVAPMTDVESMSQEKLKEYVSGGNTAFTESVRGAFESGIKGMDPNDTIAYWNKYMRPEQERLWSEEIQPTIREAYVGPGTFYGTPRVNTEVTAKTNLESKGLEDLGNKIFSERDSARGLLPAAGAFASQYEKMPLDRIEAGFQFGGLPRALEQADLAARYAEFVRTTPELSPILDKALAALGIQTQAGFFQPGDEGIMPLIQALAGAAGSAAGASAGA